MTHLFSQGDLSSNKAPLFDGSNYAFQRVRMEAYLMVLRFDVWKSFMDYYKIPESPPRDQVGKRACEANAKARNTILCVLANSKSIKIKHCRIAK